MAWAVEKFDVARIEEKAHNSLEKSVCSCWFHVM